MRTSTLRFLALAAVFSGAVACIPPWDSAWDTEALVDDTDLVEDTDPVADTDLVDDTDPDADTDTTPDVVIVSGAISANTTWTSDTIWQLQGLVFVEPNVTLTIQKGTLIQGLVGDGTPGSSGALIVAAGGQIFASGTADEPIVFTSSQPVGSRAAGDWGGLVLLGSAPVNKPAARLEGIADTDPRGLFGGIDPTHNCGVLRYVRVEFAGYKISNNSELNSITLGGCGYNTTVENVQAHQGLDDGIEVFGGTVNIRQAVISRVDDDGLDWDNGWTGYAQFIVVQQEPGFLADGTTPQADSGWEADNNDPAIDGTFSLTPRSAPTIWNVSLIGSQESTSGPTAMVLRRGTAGHFGNLLITGFAKNSIDLRDAATIAQVDGGGLTFDNVLMWDIGADGVTYFETEPTDGTSGDDDGGFVEADYFSDVVGAVYVDPQLPIEAFDLLAPDFMPAAASPAGDADNAGDPPVDAQGFFRDAPYLGAVSPTASAAWYDGWTSFPEN